MKSWPSTLPQRGLTDGYQNAFGDGRAISQTDAGIPKVRRRFSYVPKVLSVVFEMSDAQLATFKTFVESDLGGGVMPFTFPAQDESGTWTVQLGQSMPTWSPRGRGWAVRMDLLVL